MTKIIAGRSFELKKISYNSRLSEETSAYAAQLWVDGKHIADVSNHGHGGCDSAHPAKGCTRSDINEIEDFIKANTVPEDTGMKLHGEAFMTQPDLESICGDLLSDYLVEKDLKRLLGRTVAFYDPKANAVRSYKGKFTGDAAIRLIAQTMQKYPDAVILNNAPRDEAVALFKKAS
jgi:hypothetical protein